MKTSYFQPIKYSTKARREFNIGSFKGVDLTSPTFDVASNRALLLQNFVRKGDMLEKRQGLDEIYQANGSIYNIWEYGNYIVLHVDTDIIVLNENLTIKQSFASVVKAQKVTAINRNNKLYIFGGIYLYVLEETTNNSNQVVLTLTRAMDEAYVPTTTIGIGANNLEMSYDTKRQTYDDWNLLTPYHKNEFTTGYKDIDNFTSLEFKLDADFDFVLEDETIADILNNCYVQVSTYSETIGWQNYVGHFGIGSLFINNEEISTRFILADTDGYFHADVIESTRVDSTTDARAVVSSVVQGEGIQENNIILGYIDSEDYSKLVLFFNAGNYEQKINNAEIKFITKLPDDNGKYTSDYINKCTYAVSYTDTYSQNRVIVTGNEDYQNMDWRNENLNVFALQDDIDYNPNVKANDLLYFPSENVASYGSTNKAISGYGLHADGKLMVFKENSNDELVSAYIREGAQINQRYNEATGTYTYDYKLDLKSSNKGSVPVNRYSIVSYKGYIVFLGDDKKVNIVVNGDKSFATTIYSQSISHQIEKALNEYSLSLLKEKAFMFTFKEFVYLVIEDTIFALIYEKTSADEDYSFEWYIYKTNILYKEEYFTEISTIKDELFLGTNLGSLFKVSNIANNFYADHRYIELSNSEFTENVVESSKANVVEVGDYITSDYYFSLPEIETVARTITYSGRQVLASFETCEVPATDYLIDLINQLEQNEETIYTYDSEGDIQEVELAIVGNKITITIPQQVIARIVTDGSYIPELGITTPPTYEYGLSTFGTDTHLYVKQSDNYKIKVKSKDGTNIGYALEFENTEKTTQFSALGETVHSGYIEKLMPIESYYITSPLFFGTLSRYKNIYSYTISNDTNKPSELNLAIIKNNIPFKYNSKISTEDDKYGLNIGEAKFSSSMSFDLLSLESMNLDQDYIAVSAYTKYRNIFRQRYTNFVFYNKNFTNSVLSKMTLVYTITSPVVGGD